MWPFILTRTVELEKTIVASKTDVLAILQNPDQLYAQNVMIMSVVQDASDPSWYTITDRLPLIGSWATHTTVRTQFIKTTDGCDTEVHANLWTRTSGQLRVRELESSEGTVLLSEKTVVKVHTKGLLLIYLNVHNKFLRDCFF